MAKYEGHHQQRTRAVENVRARVQTLAKDLEEESLVLYEDFKERLRRDSDRFLVSMLPSDSNFASQAVRELATFLQYVHVRTLEQLMRHSGRYQSPTFGHINIFVQTEEVLLFGVIDAWETFFGTTLNREIDKFSTSLNERINSFVRESRRLIIECPELSGREESLMVMLSAIKGEIDNTTREIEENLQSEMKYIRGQLLGIIQGIVEPNLLPAIRKGATEYGIGMKGRINSEIIERLASAVIPEVFKRTQLELSSAVEKVRDFMGDLALKSARDALASSKQMPDVIFSEKPAFEVLVDFDELHLRIGQASELQKEIEILKEMD